MSRSTKKHKKSKRHNKDKNPLLLLNGFKPRTDISPPPTSRSKKKTGPKAKSKNKHKDSTTHQAALPTTPEPSAPQRKKTHKKSSSRKKKSKSSNKTTTVQPGQLIGVDPNKSSSDDSASGTGSDHSGDEGSSSESGSSDDSESESGDGSAFGISLNPADIRRHISTRRKLQSAREQRRRSKKNGSLKTVQDAEVGNLMQLVSAILDQGLEPRLAGARRRDISPPAKRPGKSGILVRDFKRLLAIHGEDYHILKRLVHSVYARTEMDADPCPYSQKLTSQKHVAYLLLEGYYPVLRRAKYDWATNHLLQQRCKNFNKTARLSAIKLESERRRRKIQQLKKKARLEAAARRREQQAPAGQGARNRPATPPQASADEEEVHEPQEETAHRPAKPKKTKKKQKPSPQPAPEPPASEHGTRTPSRGRSVSRRTSAESSHPDSHRGSGTGKTSQGDADDDSQSQTEKGRSDDEDTRVQRPEATPPLFLPQSTESSDESDSEVEVVEKPVLARKKSKTPIKREWSPIRTESLSTRTPDPYEAWNQEREREKQEYLAKRIKDAQEYQQYYKEKAAWAKKHRLTYDKMTDTLYRADGTVFDEDDEVSSSAASEIEQPPLSTDSDGEKNAPIKVEEDVQQQPGSFLDASDEEDEDETDQEDEDESEDESVPKAGSVHSSHNPSLPRSTREASIASLQNLVEAAISKYPIDVIKNMPFEDDELNLSSRKKKSKPEIKLNTGDESENDSEVEEDSEAEDSDSEEEEEEEEPEQTVAPKSLSRSQKSKSSHAGPADTGRFSKGQRFTLPSGSSHHSTHKNSAGSKSQAPERDSSSTVHKTSDSDSDEDSEVKSASDKARSSHKSSRATRNDEPEAPLSRPQQQGESTNQRAHRPFALTQSRYRSLTYDEDGKSTSKSKKRPMPIAPSQTSKLSESAGHTSSRKSRKKPIEKVASPITISSGEVDNASEEESATASGKGSAAPPKMSEVDAALRKWLEPWSQHQPKRVGNLNRSGQTNPFSKYVNKEAERSSVVDFGEQVYRVPPTSPVGNYTGWRSPQQKSSAPQEEEEEEEREQEALSPSSAYDFDGLKHHASRAFTKSNDAPLDDISASSTGPSLLTSGGASNFAETHPEELPKTPGPARTISVRGAKDVANTNMSQILAYERSAEPDRRPAPRPHPSHRRVSTLRGDSSSRVPVPHQDQRIQMMVKPSPKKVPGTSHQPPAPQKTGIPSWARPTDRVVFKDTVTGVEVSPSKIGLPQRRRKGSVGMSDADFHLAGMGYRDGRHVHNATPTVNPLAARSMPPPPPKGVPKERPAGRYDIGPIAPDDRQKAEYERNKKRAMRSSGEVPEEVIEARLGKRKAKEVSSGSKDAAQPKPKKARGQKAEEIAKGLISRSQGGPAFS